MDYSQRLTQFQPKSQSGSVSWGTKTKSTAAAGDPAAYWTCKACSKTMRLHLQGSHSSSEEHLNRCKLMGYQTTRPLVTTRPHKVNSAPREAKVYGFHATPLVEEEPVEKTYCDVCRQDYRESKKGPHLTPGWYCAVCDHYMHIISMEGHLGGKKHAAEVELQGQRGSGSGARVASWTI